MGSRTCLYIGVLQISVQVQILVTFALRPSVLRTGTENDIVFRRFWTKFVTRNSALWSNVYLSSTDLETTEDNSFYSIPDILVLFFFVTVHYLVSLCLSSTLSLLSYSVTESTPPYSFSTPCLPRISQLLLLKSSFYQKCSSCVCLVYLLNPQCPDPRTHEFWMWKNTVITRLSCCDCRNR